MAFSFYQSLRTVPAELREAARVFQLSRGCASGGWRCRSRCRALVWNMMMSMSGGWFFVVASEAITVGHTIGHAAGHRLLHRAGHRARATWARSAGPSPTMLLVIVLYDQLLFRPLVAWADKFRFEQERGARAAAVLGAADVPALAHDRSGAGALRSTLVRWTCRKVAAGAGPIARRSDRSARWSTASGSATVVAGRGARAVAYRPRSGRQHDGWPSSGGGRAGPAHAAARRCVLIALASLVWVPVGVWVGLRPRADADRAALAQFLAAFPANLLFPVVVYAHRLLEAQPRTSGLAADDSRHPVVHPVQRHRRRLGDPERTALCGAEPRRHAAGCGGARSRCRRSCPTTSPARSPPRAARGTPPSWPNWRTGARDQVQAHGLGAYIAEATAAGDFPPHRAGHRGDEPVRARHQPPFWRPLYYRAERRFRLT